MSAHPSFGPVNEFFSMRHTSASARIGQMIMVSTVGIRVQASIPPPLPPPVSLEALRKKTDQTHLVLGRLDGLTTHMPGVPVFLYIYVRKVVVLSSQIEGAQSSLSDLTAVRGRQHLRRTSERCTGGFKLRHGLNT